MNKKKIFIIVSSIIAIIVLTIIIVLITNKKPITYSVTFETNGGTLVETQIVKKDDTVQKPLNPVKEGYVFDEWTYLGKTYDFNLKVVSDLKLVAKWIKLDDNVETYNIEFDTDGGSLVSKQIVIKGNKVEKPIDPTKEGYSFVGWTLNDEIYDFDSIVEKDLELKAKWEKIKTPNGNTTNNSGNGNNSNGGSNNNNNNNKPSTPQKKTFTVTFNLNGGIGTSTQTVVEGNKATRPNNPSRNGYNFAGWLLNGKEYDFNSIVTGNITLEAKWVEVKKNNYTVTFNSNGGTAVSSQTVVEGSKASKPNDPTKSGYNFKGWLLNGRTYDFNSSITGNITLVANWVQKNYKIIANSVDQTATFSKKLTIYEDEKIISVKEIQYIDGQFICSGDNLNVNYYAIQGETNLKIVLNDGTIVIASLVIN